MNIHGRSGRRRLPRDHGCQSLLWGSDYPHAESTWPRSQEAVDKLFAGVAADDRAAMTGGTIARLFDFDLETSAVAAQQQ